MKGKDKKYQRGTSRVRVEIKNKIINKIFSKFLKMLKIDDLQ